MRAQEPGSVATICGQFRGPFFDLGHEFLSDTREGIRLVGGVLEEAVEARNDACGDVVDPEFGAGFGEGVAGVEGRSCSSGVEVVADDEGFIEDFL